VDIDIGQELGRDNNAAMGRLVKRRGRVVPAAVLDAGGQARSLLAAARQQADQLLAEARAEAAAVRATAHESTRATLEAEFTTLLVAARADAERVRAAALPAARGLAVRMAEKILGRALELNDDVVTGIAARALASARTRAGVVTLRIHPGDRAAVEAARPELAARLAAAVELRVVDDPTVSRGGCVVDTPAGRLDARLETQLAALERAAFGDTGQEAPRG
jgi:type III secretion protein L